MQVILKETIRKLGSVGQVVKVKRGFARNYLIPYKKVVPATASNLENLKKEAEHIKGLQGQQIAQAKQIDEALGKIDVLPIFSNVSKEGKLFGSVTAKEIIAALAEQKIEISRKNIILTGSLKEPGEHTINIYLHPEVSHKLKIHVLDVSKRHGTTDSDDSAL